MVTECQEGSDSLEGGKIFHKVIFYFAFKKAGKVAMKASFNSRFHLSTNTSAINNMNAEYNWAELPPHP